MTALALLGAGAIAQQVAAALSASGELRIVAVAATRADSPRVRSLRSAVPYDVPYCDPDALAGSPADWVFEAAGAGATRELIPALLAAGKDVIAMSSGVFLDPEVADRCSPALGEGRRLVFPSGAIAGLDGVSALARAGIVSDVTLTSTKAPSALRGAPFFPAGEPADDFAGVVFDGNARDAARSFPANANVAATLSFAGVGPERTRVRILSDPAARRTRHEITCTARGAEISLRAASDPSPLNPRSSLLAALSAIDTVIKATGRSSGLVEATRAGSRA